MKLTKTSNAAAIVLALSFIFDRALKWLAEESLSRAPEGFFLFKQLGVGFFLNQKFLGLVNLPPAAFWPLIFIFAVFIILLLRKATREGKRGEAAALSLVLSGALSNSLDRLYYGAVIDYLYAGPWVINLADILIITGVILYLSSKSQIPKAKQCLNPKIQIPNTKHKRF